MLTSVAATSTLARDWTSIAADPTQGRVRFVADDRALLTLGLKKVALTIATLGLYHFWGRAGIKRAMYGAIRIDGEALTWTGHGRESLATFVIAAAIASPAIVFLIWFFLFRDSSAAAAGMLGHIKVRRLAISLPLLFFMGSAVYRRRTHILRRTWFRGARSDMTGHAWSYAALHFWTSFTVPLTLGWALPWRTERLAARVVRETSYAGHIFGYRPEWRALMKPFACVWAAAAFVYLWMIFALAWALGPELTAVAQTHSLAVLKTWHVAAQAIPILLVAVSSFYLIAKAFNARLLRHQAACTTLGSARFSLRLPVGGYVWMTASNLVLRVATLGSLTPWCEARHWRFLIAHVEIHGPLPAPKA